MSAASFNVWLMIAAAGIATFLIRLSFIALLGKLNAPEWFTRLLSFVPPAVLSAIIFRDVLIQNGALINTLANPRLLAALIAGVVAWRTKNALITIGIGMAALIILNAVM